MFEGFAGAAIGAAASAFGQHQANKANQAMSREQMRWQQDMSNSAYQRQAVDMRLAGLNPIAMSPGGASTPPGAAAQVQNELSAANGVGASAVEAARNLQSIRNMKQDEKTGASQQALNEAQKIKSIADAALSSTNAKGVAIRNTLLTNELPGSEIESNYSKSKIGKVLSYIKRGSVDASDILNNTLGTPFKLNKIRPDSNLRSSNYYPIYLNQ